jgi:glucose repression regulatory protein TUP1
MQEIYSLDFSRDGQFLVSGSGDKSAKIWNIETGTCVFDLKIEDFVMGDSGPIDAGITSVARESAEVVRRPGRYANLFSGTVSPDSRLVAAGSLDTIVRVWDTATGHQVERLKGHKDSVYRYVFLIIPSCALQITTLSPQRRLLTGWSMPRIRFA